MCSRKGIAKIKATLAAGEHPQATWAAYQPQENVKTHIISNTPNTLIFIRGRRSGDSGNAGRSTAGKLSDKTSRWQQRRLSNASHHDPVGQQAVGSRNLAGMLRTARTQRLQPPRTITAGGSQPRRTMARMERPCHADADSQDACTRRRPRTTCIRFGAFADTCEHAGRAKGRH